MKNIFSLSITFIITAISITQLYSMDRPVRMAKADVYMLIAEGERLNGEAVKQATAISTRSQIILSALQKAFDQHQFSSMDCIRKPYVITHELRIEELPIYRNNGMSEFTDNIFSEMYSREEDTPLYSRFNVDKSYFSEFDTKYQNGIIRRIGEWTYGERIGDGVIKLIAFFYDPSILKVENILITH